MSEYLNVDALLEPRAETDSGLPEEDVTIPGLGKVRIRALNRDEAFAVQQITATAASERKMVALSMVRPQVTEAQVFRWQQASIAGELEELTVRISALSGIGKGAAKSGVPGDGAEPGDRVRDVPSVQAGDDGAAVAPGDE